MPSAAAISPPAISWGATLKAGSFAMSSVSEAPRTDGCPSRKTFTPALGLMIGLAVLCGAASVVTRFGARRCVLRQPKQSEFRSGRRQWLRDPRVCCELQYRGLRRSPERRRTPAELNLLPPGDTFTVSVIVGVPLADVTFEDGLGLVFGSPFSVLGSETLPISDLSGALTVEHFTQLESITLHPDAFYAISVNIPR
jgi:hypothetical protein